MRHTVGVLELEHRIDLPGVAALAEAVYAPGGQSPKRDENPRVVAT
jgi:hypothetical protein